MNSNSGAERNVTGSILFLISGYSVSGELTIFQNWQN